MCRFSSARILRVATALLALVTLAAASCTGGESTTPPPGTLQSTRYSVGGTVSGLTGSGLVLQSSTGEKLPRTSDGAFTFQTMLTTGTSYYVVVAGQPSGPTQSCTISNGTGTMAAANVTDIVVACQDKTTNMDSVGGVVVGAQGSGLVLQNNGTDNLPVTSSGSFSFPHPLAADAAYSVSVLSPPLDPYQDCLVTNSPGTTGASDVANVVVTCTVNSNPTHNINVTAANVTGTITLQNNARDPLKISSSGTFPFSMQIPSGSPYKVIVTAVDGAPSQSCTLQNFSGVVGSSDVDVQLSCKVAPAEDAVTVAVSGLSGSGLVLQDNLGDNLTAQNGLDTFANVLTAGTPYSVSVLSQPTAPNQICNVVNSTGTAGSNAAAPTVTCTTILYQVSGTVTGLIGTDSVVLQDDGSDNLTVGANGAFSFLTKLSSITAYDVTVLTQPLGPAETCSVANATGQAGAAGPGPVVNCLPNPVSVTVTVTGLIGSGLMLQDNGGNGVPVTANGTIAFPAQPYGSTYNINVLAQPTNLNQTCTVSNATGSAGISAPAPAVTCVPSPNTISVTVRGLTEGSSLVLQDNGGDNLTVGSNGTFPFATQLLSGSAYTVTVLTQPGPSETCTVANGTGTAGAAGPAPMVTCALNYAAITGTVTGLQGSGLVLQDDGGDNLVIQSNGPFTFPTKLVVGTSYSVTVLTQPTGPSQVCTVANGTGSAGGGGPQAAVTCAFTLGVTVKGLNANQQGGSLFLQNNNGDQVQVALAGPYSVNFPTPLASGTNYSVRVATQPGTDTSGARGLQTSIVCVVSNGSGTITNSNVSVTANCLEPIGFAYVTNSGDSTLSTYLVDQNGALLASGTAVPTGSEPSGVLAKISNTDGFLYVTNQKSNDLSVYSIDPNTGIPTNQNANTQGLVNAPATIAPGAFGLLYATGSSTAPNDSILYSLSTGAGTSLSNQTGSPFLSPEESPSADTRLIEAETSVNGAFTNYFLTAGPSVNTLYAIPTDASGVLAFGHAIPAQVGPTPTSVAALNFTYPAGVPHTGDHFSVAYVATSGDGAITSYILSSEDGTQVSGPACKFPQTITKGNMLQLAAASNGAQSVVFATDATQLYAYQASSDGFAACLNEIAGSQPFPVDGAATPGPLATFYVTPSAASAAFGVSAAIAVYAVDVGGTTIHVFTVTPNGLTTVTQQGIPATATTGKAPSSIVVTFRPAFAD